MFVLLRYLNNYYHYTPIMISITLAIPAFLLGVFLLWKGSDKLVDGTSKIAAQIGISTLIPMRWSTRICLMWPFIYPRTPYATMVPTSPATAGDMTGTFSKTAGTSDRATGGRWHLIGASTYGIRSTTWPRRRRSETYSQRPERSQAGRHRAIW